MQRTGLGRFAIVALVLLSTTGIDTPAGATTANHAPTAPTMLTVDDAAAPLAVEGAPQFGWVVNDPDRGEVQTAYEIKVEEPQLSGGAGRTVWDSGEVRSGQQAYVTPHNLDLDPDRSYVWTVRTWDHARRVGPYSRPARFDTGLRDSDWNASWIRRPGAEKAGVEDFSLLRKEIGVAGKVVRARAYMGAGQQYDLRMNGVRVAHGPSYAYPDEQYYEATDITNALVSGRRNVVGVLTHWSTSSQGKPASVPAMIAHITIDYADGTRQVVASDATWRTRAAPYVQGPFRNDEGDFVEHLDGRLDPVGWDEAGFDDKGWVYAEKIGRHPVAPFLHLYAARSHIVEHPERPVTFKRMRNGAYVADYGAVIAATPVVEFHDGATGRAVKIVAGYLLDPDGHVSTTRDVQQTDMHWDYDERAGAQEFRPFDYLAFRYLEVIGAGEPLKAENVTAFARHASFPDEHAAKFDSSNPTLNADWNLLRHSILYATQEQFLDTPTREKGAFQDPNTSSATMAAFDDRAMTYQALRDVARSQKRYWPDGRTNNVYPNGDGKRDIPDATEQYVEWVWQTYLQTGDDAQLSALYPVVKNIADYVARAIDKKTGLVTNLPGGGSDYLYGLVDWPPQMRYGYDMNTVARTTENVLASRVFSIVAAFGLALHRPDAERQTELDRASKLAHAMDALRRPDGVIVDGLDADGTQSKHASQIANAMALAYGLVPSAQERAVADHIVKLRNSIGVSTYGYLLAALHTAGRDDAFVASLTDPTRPGLAHILKEGATYTWESWDARQVGDSESHAFGSNVLTLIQEDLLGVQVVAPGAAQVSISTPAVSPMRMSGVAVTQRGRIPISWDRGAPGHFSLEVTVPANVVADISIPAAAASVSESGVALAGDPGITKVKAVGGDSVIVFAGSGHYRFEVPGRIARAISRSGSSSSGWLVGGIVAIAVIALASIAVIMLRRRSRTAAKA